MLNPCFAGMFAGLSTSCFFAVAFLVDLQVGNKLLLADAFLDETNSNTFVVSTYGARHPCGLNFLRCLNISFLLFDFTLSSFNY